MAEHDLEKARRFDRELKFAKTVIGALDDLTKASNNTRTSQYRAFIAESLVGIYEHYSDGRIGLDERTKRIDSIIEHCHIEFGSEVTTYQRKELHSLEPTQIEQELELRGWNNLGYHRASYLVGRDRSTLKKNVKTNFSEDNIEWGDQPKVLLQNFLERVLLVPLADAEKLASEIEAKGVLANDVKVLTPPSQIKR